MHNSTLQRDESQYSNPSSSRNKRSVDSGTPNESLKYSCTNLVIYKQDDSPDWEYKYKSLKDKFDDL